MDEILHQLIWYLVVPTIDRDLYIPGGAGFLPSTVSWVLARYNGQPSSSCIFHHATWSKNSWKSSAHVWGNNYDSRLIAKVQKNRNLNWRCVFIACCVVICLMCVMILQRCMNYSKFDIRDIRIYTIYTIELFLRIILLVGLFLFDFYSCLFLEFNSSIVLHVVVLLVVVVAVVVVVLVVLIIFLM